jgi:two-component system sensor histidine kinase KdpD
MNDDAAQNRPDPEALLEQTKKEERGRLKIFLGMAPGVGKTYAMLQAAQQRLKEGQDIVVGVVETHGRKETLALTHGLEILPRQKLQYKDKAFEEMDLDAILARKPELVLVDEFAHTNVAGSRHTKRYQDVEELLAAGINVYTTLNIQHLESLNDVIERITKIKVQETLPDSLLQLADEIELVDISPEDLIRRLKEGKVYMEEYAQRAMENFFMRGNLAALREIALRTAAERVDRDVTDYMKTHAVTSIWPTKDRLLVCVDESGNSETLVRMAARIGARAKLPWMALHVETQTDTYLTDKEKDNIAEALSLTEHLGGEAITIRGGTNIANDILAFARSRNVTRILIGRHGKTGLMNALFPSVSTKILEAAQDFDITLLHSTKYDRNETGLLRRIVGISGKFSLRDYFYSTLAVAGTLLLSLALQFVLPTPNLSLVFLFAVLFSAIRYGLWPSLYTVVLSSLTFNFFFTEPKLTFHVYDYFDIITLIFYTIVAVITGNLAVRLKNQIEALQASSNRNAVMHEYSRKLSSALTLDDVMREAVESTSESFQLKTVIILPSSKQPDKLEIKAMGPHEAILEKKDWAAAEWAFKYDKPAGLGSETLPAAKWLFKPLRGPRGLVGLMGVAPFEDKDEAFDTADQRRMLYAFCDQTALAIDRAKLSIDIEESRLQNETERLRTALLSSISHDLRTPLSSIIGAATTLSDMHKELGTKQREELLNMIQSEAERLNRFVQNLLDMTKLGHGAMEPKREWIGDIRDILGRASGRLSKVLNRHKIEYRIDDNVANLYVDPILLEQVMVNILENAAKYSPPDTKIVIAVEKAKDKAVIKITDQGYGIPDEDKEKIFDMFYRVRAGDSKAAGTGLGLAICRGIIESHGGKIHAESGFKNKGTVIVITFPMKMANKKTFSHLGNPPPPIEEDEEQ